MANHGPKDSLCHLMAFRLEIIQVGKFPYLAEFDETPIFWYPRVARDAWIDFSSWTVDLRTLECQENPAFLSLSFFPSLSLSLSLSFSLSLSLYLFFLSLFPCLFFFSSPCLPSFPSLSHRIPLPSCLFLSNFSISFSFSHFFLFSHFLIFFFFSFLLLLASPTRMDQVGETSPHFPPLPLSSFPPCVTPYGIHMIMPCVSRSPMPRKT